MKICENLKTRGESVAKKSVANGLSILKNQLKSGEYDNIYLFFGEEDFLKSYYFGTLKKNLVDEDFADFNYVVFEGVKQDFDEITLALETPPMMAQRKVVVIKYSTIFSKATEQAKQYWSEKLSGISDDVVLIFYEEEVDKRGVLYKAIEKYGVLVECVYLEGVELINWIGRGCREAGKTIGKAEVEYLIRSCDGGMNNIKRELEKLFAYCQDKITCSDIDKIVTKMPQSRVFDMVNALMKKDAKTVFARLDELKVLKESAFMILAMLFTNFERIFHAKLLLERGQAPNTIAAAIKVSPYFVRDYINAANGFEKQFLRETVKEIARIDYNIKQGKVDEWIGIENFLAKCMAR
ncbi:MAG: DNA polymerase III subunit delta [Ruminococcaceae bacterium]|nr:DNA polymerase III subunit delta [Oscillospiraceae bacterium]